ncbi:unnamed protein product [Diamesa hyperborea]
MQTFLNEFLITTTNFLNGFVSDVDERFYEFESKLSKIEGSLLIIEAKLASVPSRDEKPIENLPVVPVSTTTKQEVKIETVTEVVLEENSVQEISKKDDDNINLIRICDDSLYKKYFKMLKVGVPLPAVKVKMGAEGLDGSLLDNPDLMIEPNPEINEQ